MFTGKYFAFCMLCICCLLDYDYDYVYPVPLRYSSFRQHSNFFTLSLPLFYIRVCLCLHTLCNSHYNVQCVGSLPVKFNWKDCSANIYIVIVYHCYMWFACANITNCTFCSFCPALSFALSRSLSIPARFRLHCTVIRCDFYVSVDGFVSLSMALPQTIFSISLLISDAILIMISLHFWTTPHFSLICCIHTKWRSVFGNTLTHSTR